MVNWREEHTNPRLEPISRGDTGDYMAVDPNAGPDESEADDLSEGSDE